MNRLARFVWVPALMIFAAVADDGGAETGSETVKSGQDEDLQLEKCIHTAYIRNTDILDDRTIVFYMRQKKIFVNQLPNRCFGLRMADGFAYNVSGLRLCDIDTIRVFRSFGNKSDMGPSCGLGMFRPVTEEEVAILKNREAETSPKEPESDEDTEE